MNETPLRYTRPTGGNYPGDHGYHAALTRGRSNPDRIVMWACVLAVAALALILAVTK